MEQARQLLSPGPTDPHVLHLQHSHRSTAIWNTQEEKVLTCRRNDRTLHRVHRVLDLRILHCLTQAGFYGWYRLGFIELDWALITALIERWRVETHTFHLPVGESTITLQDVAILSGLPVDGDPVTGVDTQRAKADWQQLCLELLGLEPPADKLKGGRLCLSWLTDNFSRLPDGASDETVRCHTRACILVMIGGHLLSDKSQNMVKLIFLPLLRDLEACGRLSWGAAGLACLYRHMCEATKPDISDVAGPLILLQLWAWERLSHITPVRLSRTFSQPQPVMDDIIGDDGHDEVEDVQTEHDSLLEGPYGCRWHVHLAHSSTIAHSLRHYRDHIDQMRDEQMIWQPYTVDILKQLPAYCLTGQEIWRTRAPLICFDVIELHLPDRVLRQFGMKQPIPQRCDTNQELHATTRRGRAGYDWADVHISYITEWRERRSHVVDGEAFEGRLEYSDPYMQWYMRITRSLILPPTKVPSVGFQPVAAIRTLLVNSLARVHQISVETLHAYDGDQGMGALERIREICRSTFSAISEEQHLDNPPPLTCEPPTQAPPSNPIRRRGIQRGFWS